MKTCLFHLDGEEAIVDKLLDTYGGGGRGGGQGHLLLELEGKHIIVLAIRSKEVVLQRISVEKMIVFACMPVCARVRCRACFSAVQQ